MRRRDLLRLAGGAAAALPLVARAQPGGRLRRIGVLIGSADDPIGQSRLAAFRQGLKDLKWTEGANIQLDVRWGAGDLALIRTQIAEIVALAPDVILGSNTPVMRALKPATQTIPIVFAGLADPVGDGIVASLAHPGGNITGFASFNGPIAGLWLQNLKQIAPATKRVAVLYNPDTAPHALFWPTLESIAPTTGVTLIRATVRDVAAIEAAIAAVAGAPGGAVLLLPDTFTARHRKLIHPLLARHAVPAIFPLREWVPEGGLIAYGPDFVDQFRRAAGHVDRILRGTKPSDLAVQQPVKFEMAINMNTARALGLTVPRLLRAQADEVIE